MFMRDDILNQDVEDFLKITQNFRPVSEGQDGLAVCVRKPLEISQPSAPNLFAKSSHFGHDSRFDTLVSLNLSTFDWGLLSIKET